MSTHKVLEVIWFSGRDTVGAVLTCNEAGEYKVYIGPCKTGLDEDTDARYIADWGAKIYDPALRLALFPRLKDYEPEISA